MPVAQGSPRRGQRRIVICMDEETFDQVAGRAVRLKTSFAEQARLLIEWGLEAAEDE